MPSRKLACIMFSDMVGYSSLAQRDEQRALELLDEQRAILRPLLDRHGGHEIKTIGDGMLVEFPSAVEAARCAIEIQEALRRRNETAAPDRRFELRIGLHVGDVFFREDDVYGEGVNLASRVEGCAPPGGVCLTAAVAHQVATKLSYPVVPVGSRRLKNIEGPIELHRIALPWDREAVSVSRGAARWWRQPRVRRALAFGAPAVAAVVVVLLWVAANPRGRAASGEVESVESLAVLPLENLSDDPGQAYFVEGMHEAMISELAQIAALRVISRTSVLSYRDAPKSIPEIAKELGVDAVVEGSVLKAGDRVRITAQLVDGATDRHLWSRSYEGSLADVLALQRDVAREIAREIRVELTPQESARLASARPVDPEAHEAYLRGRWYRDQGSPEDLEKAFEHFQRAITEDPDYAPAYAGLAGYYSVLPFYSNESPVRTLPRAREMALRALELDEGLAEAHAAMAYIRAYYEWDWEAAEREFRRALELQPSSADVHFSYSRFLAAQRRFPEAFVEIRRARELDPLSLLLKANVALLHYFQGDLDEAEGQLRETLEIDPELGVARWGLGLVLVGKGRPAEGIVEIERAAAGSGSMNTRSSLGYAYAVGGQPTKAREVLTELEVRARESYVPAYFFAVVEAGLGEREQAFDWLEKAYEERSSVLAYLQVDPRLDSVRDDPRFEALVRRLRFPTRAPSQRG